MYVGKGRHYSSHGVADVPDALPEPDLPDADLLHLLQLRLHAPRRHRPQRHRIQPQHHEDIRHS